MKIEYIQKGDYLLPNLTLESDENYGRFGKYGILRLHFIKENKKAFYMSLLIKNKLKYHLKNINDMAESRLETLMNNYKKSDKRLSEKSKELNQIEWVQLMNNYKNMAEEIVLKEIVYD